MSQNVSCCFCYLLWKKLHFLKYRDIFFNFKYRLAWLTVWWFLWMSNFSAILYSFSIPSFIIQLSSLSQQNNPNNYSLWNQKQSNTHLKQTEEDKLGCFEDNKLLHFYWQLLTKLSSLFLSFLIEISSFKNSRKKEEWNKIISVI